MFPLKIKNIPRCPCVFAAMSWSASVQCGNHGYKPYLRGKNQAGLKTDWMCRDKGLPDLKLRVLGGQWNQQETNTQKGADQAAKSLGITVQTEEMIPNTVYLQIFRNILALFNLRILQRMNETSYTEISLSQTERTSLNHITQNFIKSCTAIAWCFNFEVNEGKLMQCLSLYPF